MLEYCWCKQKESLKTSINLQNVILLDDQSTMSLVCNKNTVTNIHNAQTPLMNSWIISNACYLLEHIARSAKRWTPKQPCCHSNTRSPIIWILLKSRRWATMSLPHSRPDTVSNVIHCTSHAFLCHSLSEWASCWTSTSTNVLRLAR